MSIITVGIFILITAFGACKSPKVNQQADTNNKVPQQIIQDTIKKKESAKAKIFVPNSEDSLDIKIGQMILVGINDMKTFMPNDSIIREIQENKVGGIILFEKNISPKNSHAELAKLIKGLQAQSKIPMFVAIDEEGGKVHRLKPKYGFIDVPTAEYLGSRNQTDSTFYHASALAKLLNDLGINLNFAPDIDLAINPENPVIAKAKRSYSSDPMVVAKHGLAFIRAHHVHKVRTAIKHFPGHGSSLTDSHLGITNVTKQWNEIELIPFAEIIKSGQVDAVMTAHIVNCKLDTTCLPATLSYPIINGILRQRLNFNGVIFSDDMQMFAISRNYGTENAVRMSINAGVDIVLFGNNVYLPDRISASEIHAMIKKLVRENKIPEQRINESYNRIMALKNRKF